jgi:cyclohexanone monooxygenase
MSVAGDDDLDLDLAALKEKYRLERDKRLREDGADQYIELSGKWAAFNESDPYASRIVEREPVTDQIEVAVIGGGFSGLLASARLLEAGIDDFHVIEAGSDFGGTWYWNRYPGAQCDIESYCYLPLLEELGYMPKEKYSYGDEIFEHSQRIGRHYGLYDRTWFQTRVRSIDWDDQLRRWRITTNRGDDIKARFVILALGTASRGKLPGIPGIDDFEGHAFHTSRWDYAYTGGLEDGRMTKLADKRVAIIGTGATAIQCVPRVAEYAQHLYVFQRTPSSVDLRGNSPTDPEWWASLEPGWQRQRRDNFGAILSGRPVEEDLVDDGWTSTFHDVMELARRDGALTGRDLAELLELADFRKMEQIRRRAEELVDDPATAEALKPYYRRFCKRPTFNDEYLPAFNRPNVTLVDVSASKGVERITAGGVVANGVEHEVDCIVYASGFEITTEFRRRLGLGVNGRAGASLFDRWKPGHTRTLHGFSTRDFPNWFYIGISQNAFSANMTQMFDEQARHIAYIVAETRRRGATTVEPTVEGQEAWAAVIESGQGAAKSFFESCTPGYYNNEGQGGGGLGGGAYTPGIIAFNALLEEWRAEGSMAGLELDRDVPDRLSR